MLGALRRTGGAHAPWRGADVPKAPLKEYEAHRRGARAQARGARPEGAETAWKSWSLQENRARTFASGAHLLGAPAFSSGAHLREAPAFSSRAPQQEQMSWVRAPFSERGAPMRRAHEAHCCFPSWRGAGPEGKKFLEVLGS